MSKLTLSVDEDVIARAKRYASKRGVSLSQLVETYLDEVSEPRIPVNEPRLLRSVRGILKKADPRQYKDHLAGKYL
jgi:antitoxin component of RelBE/YafQ-DinJ toxin-antitoxin module